MLGVKLDAVAVPPCVFDTVFTSVSVATWSLLVIVQVAFWPGVSVTVPFAAQSPPHAPAVYPARLVSVAVCAPAPSVTAVPQVVAVPSMLGVKFADVALPPCVFDTVFTSVNVAD